VTRPLPNVADGTASSLRGNYGTAASDVERHGDQAADVEHLHIAAFFDDFAGDLMPQD
jgi:hypothetical protein